jgi:hypothetical protein
MSAPNNVAAEEVALEVAAVLVALAALINDDKPVRLASPLALIVVASKPC